jgi:hypothetical protein
MLTRQPTLLRQAPFPHASPPPCLHKLGNVRAHAPNLH